MLAMKAVSPLDELAAAVVQRLVEKRLTIATAESCTGGLIAEVITRVPGASKVFGFGWVTYANAAKERLLGVPADLISCRNAVSEPVVRAMAEGALARSQADVAVAVSGLAGPGGGSPGIPVGTVWLAWASRFSPTRAHLVMRPLPRREFREMTAEYALRGVLEMTLGE